MRPVRMFAATGDAVARIDVRADDVVDVAIMLQGSGAQFVAVDPRDPRRVVAGTYGAGALLSRDAGATWRPLSSSLSARRVMSVAIAGARIVDGLSSIYAGSAPSHLYRSDDDGETWHRLRAFDALVATEGDDVTNPAAGASTASAQRWRSRAAEARVWVSHVSAILPHSTDPLRLLAGVEIGGVIVTSDGGATWRGPARGCYHDVHVLVAHPDFPEWVYEAAGGGVAVSDDGGERWQSLDDGLDQRYVWSAAVDSGDPGCCYVSTSHSHVEAHRRDGRADACIYRHRAGGPWQPINGPIADPLPYLASGLAAPRGQAGVLLAAMQDGAFWATEDQGETWRPLRGRVPGVVALVEA